MSIASDLIRGNTETIILAHLMKGDGYGYQINKSIMKRTENLYELKEATLYTAFRRLEESGSIESYWGDEQRGARRRYYRITERGRGDYDRLRKEWKNARNIIDTLIEMEEDNDGR